jgi:hypothetical protein
LWIGCGTAQVLGREQATPAWWRCAVSFTRLVEAARRHHSFKPSFQQTLAQQPARASVTLEGGVVESHIHLASASPCMCMHRHESVGARDGCTSCQAERERDAHFVIVVPVTVHRRPIRSYIHIASLRFSNLHFLRYVSCLSGRLKPSTVVSDHPPSSGMMTLRALRTARRVRVPTLGPLGQQKDQGTARDPGSHDPHAPITPLGSGA